MAHSAPIRTASTIRSTVLQSSLASLRARGHFAAWSALIDPVHRTAIVESLAPGWMPMEIALAHYEACEAMRLPMSEQTALGEAVGDRIQGSFLATLMRTARAAGYNPLVLLRQFDRLWARVFQGGSVQLTLTGPKDLDIELRGLPLCRIPYFRVGFCGVVRAGIAFSGVKTSIVRAQAYSPQSQAFVMHAAWV